MTKAKGLLHSALKEESRLREWVKPGLLAFDNQHRKLIHESQRNRVAESLDLDEACRKEFPNAHRWDYIVSIGDLAKLIGIEPHSAKDSEASEVIQKKKNAEAYLQNHLVAGKRIGEWYWVTEGKVKFTNMSREKRKLDQNGIKFMKIIRAFQ